MSPQGRQTHPLRMITQRLGSIASDDLPHATIHLTRALLDCKDILSSPAGSGKDNSENSVLLHKYKTQLSTLLQDKTVGGRWSATVLIKATVEAGGLEIVDGAASWVRSLLGFLAKPDPLAVKKLVLITLTRIFSLTHGNPTVIRQITTPSLPQFITACLNCVSTNTDGTRTLKSGSSILTTVLQTLIILLPHHPASFRPFVAQIRSVLSSLLAPTPSNLVRDESSSKRVSPPSRAVIGLAQRLCSILPYCAPKNTSSEQWRMQMNVIKSHANRTADLVFRAVVEDHIGESTTNISKRKAYNETLGDKIEDDLSLPAWEGIHAGAERLVGSLQILQAHIGASSSSSFALPVGSIWSLLERILSVFGPSESSSGAPAEYSRINAEIERDEREGLWSMLPDIHQSALELLSVLLDRVDRTSISLAHTALERIYWVFERDKYRPDVRAALYRLSIQLVHLIGPSLSKATVVLWRPMLEAACSDAVPLSRCDKLYTATESEQRSTAAAIAGNAGSASTRSQTEQSNASQKSSGLANLSSKLLDSSLANVQSECWPVPLRALIDRTIILTQNKEAMLSSVLRPPIAASSKREANSIVPFLARAFPESHAVESILRPRLPVIRGRHISNVDGEEEEDDIQDSPMIDRPPGTPYTSNKASPLSGKKSQVLPSELRSQDQAQAPWLAPAALMQQPGDEIVGNAKEQEQTRNRTQVFQQLAEELSRAATPEAPLAGLKSPKRPHDFNSVVENLTLDKDMQPLPKRPRTADHESVVPVAIISSKDHADDARSDSDSSSGIPSIHMDSDLDDEEDEEDE